MPTNILRRNAVEQLTGLSRSTLYAMMDRGEFPRPVKLSTRAVGWLSSEIDEWLQGRLEQKTVDARHG
ncbi:MAG: AlpA family transcriptional regulator [Roseovarius sp.]